MSRYLPSASDVLGFVKNVTDVPQDFIRQISSDGKRVSDSIYRNAQCRWELINRSVQTINPDTTGGRKFTRATLDWKSISISSSMAEASSETLRIRASEFSLLYTDVPSRRDQSIEQPENTRRVIIDYASSEPSPGSASTIIEGVLDYRPPEVDGVVEPMVIYSGKAPASTKGTEHTK